MRVRDDGQRVVAWFSCGGPSAVTAKLAIAKAPVFLDELDPTLGANDEEPQFDCSLFCHIAEAEIAA